VFHSEELQNLTKYQGTQWKFITTRNPREGGAWERIVGIQYPKYNKQKEKCLN